MAGNPLGTRGAHGVLKGMASRRLAWLEGVLRREREVGRRRELVLAGREGVAEGELNALNRLKGLSEGGGWPPRGAVCPRAVGLDGSKEVSREVVGAPRQMGSCSSSSS